MIITGVYLCMIPVAWILIWGMVLSYQIHQWNYRSLIWENRGADLAFAVVWSMIAGVGWPIFLPFSFAFTNFAEHGFRWMPVTKAELPSLGKHN